MCTNRTIRATVWNEFRHEKKNADIAKIYPKGMHAVIAEALNRAGGIAARMASLDEPEHGLSEEVLKNTDVKHQVEPAFRPEVDEIRVHTFEEQILAQTVFQSRSGVSHILKGNFRHIHARTAVAQDSQRDYLVAIGAPKLKYFGGRPQAGLAQN